MTSTQNSQWKDRDKLINIPTPRNELCFRHNDHSGNSRKTHADRILERLKDFRDLDEEVGEFDFFRCGAPGHVDAEHVAEKCLRDMEGHAAEEEDEH